MKIHGFSDDESLGYPPGIQGLEASIWLNVVEGLVLGAEKNTWPLPVSVSINHGFVASILKGFFPPRILDRFPMFSLFEKHQFSAIRGMPFFRGTPKNPYHLQQKR